MQLTFDNSASAETLVDFPLPLRLDAAVLDYAHTGAAGEDVVFTDADGTTVLSHEIERWDEAGTSFVWVEVPAIDGGSTTDHVWMYYGCTSPPAPYPAGVWDDGFAAVWHLSDFANDEWSSAEHADATGGGCTGGQNGNALTQGVFAGGQDFDGNDFVRVPDGAALDVTGAITFEAWARFDVLPGNNEFGYVTGKYDTGADDRSYALYLYESEPRFIISYDGVDATTAAWSGVTAATGQWYYLVGVYAGDSGSTAVRIYVDGVFAGSDAGPVPAQIHAGAADLVIGGKLFAGEPNLWVDAQIDEVRVSNVARSAAWIATQHFAMTGGFVTFGDEEGL
jgi:biopolymer transport protein ExbB